MRQDRSPARVLETYFCSTQAKVTQSPKFTNGWRQQFFWEGRNPAHEIFCLFAKGKIDAIARAEHIADQRKFFSFDVFEEQRRPTRSNHAPVDFRNFELGVDFRVNFYQITPDTKGIQKRTQVGEVRGCSHKVPGSMMAFHGRDKLRRRRF